MQKRYAKELHNRDQVEVRVAPGTWVIGYIEGNVAEISGEIFANVQTAEYGRLPMVRHTDLR